MEDTKNILKQVFEKATLSAADISIAPAPILSEVMKNVNEQETEHAKAVALAHTQKRRTEEAEALLSETVKEDNGLELG